MLQERMGNKPFSEVPADFVSFTFSMSVFRGLNRYIANPKERKGIVDQLHLILEKESPYYEMVKGDMCFENGVLRDSSMENFALKKAQSLLLSKECLYDLREESFEFKLNNSNEFVTFDFKCLNDNIFPLEDDKIMVPNGCMVFIGGNGSGKSTAMYKLAKLIYTDSDIRRKKDYIEHIGELRPNNIGISKMIVVSYSPFDNFLMPAWSEELDVSSDRFVYCGIRDTILERTQLLQQQDREDGHASDVLLEDRQNRTKLKSIQLLAEEFVMRFKSLVNDNKRQRIWEEIADAAESLHPELSLEMRRVASGDTDSRKELFTNLSTGNKYIFHMLATVLATIEDDSLVLFDEPENHIHPPLLSFLLSSFRRILYDFNSVVFISTHSPVIVQETFANNVYVIRRIGDNVVMCHPEIETYGANIGEITSEVFSLTSDNISYYKLFRKLYKRWLLDYSSTVDEMLDSFEEKLGHEISEQLTAYLIDLWYRDNPDE